MRYAISSRRSAAAAFRLFAFLGIPALRELLKRRPRAKLTAAGSLRAQNILIVGGQLSNLGVQALTFLTIDNLRERFSDKKIVLLSFRDASRPEGEKQNYRFTILPWDLEIKALLLGARGKHLRKLRGRFYSSEYIADMRRILSESDFFLDVSGYSLSSQWPLHVNLQYLLNILIARKFSIPFFILPQSFGPFEFSKLRKCWLDPFMKRLLGYPEAIFARERESLTALRKFTQHNVIPERHLDMALLNRGFDLSRLFHEIPPRKSFQIPHGSVAVFPNLRVMERTDAKAMYRCYQDMIDLLDRHGKSVWVLSHTREIDRDVVLNIRRNSKERAPVRGIEDPLHIWEMEDVIRQFDFIIASRYHAAVHAFKNGIPALVIGWAPKYVELLEWFGQSAYWVDARESLNPESILAKLTQLIRNAEAERRIIRARMKELEGLDNEDAFAVLHPSHRNIQNTSPAQDFGD